MIKLWLIRHGKTEGNKLARYIGTTDEPLCQEGIEFLKKMDYPKVQEIYVSPLRRCVQTAEILFPEKPVHIIEELAECDFGEFENKNYKELDGNPNYQAWIDSDGRLPFPEGEDRECFIKRTMEGFRQMTEQAWRENCGQIAAVVHGGSIMAILSCLMQDDYFAYQVPNLAGYAFQYEGAGKIQAVRRIEP